MWTFSLMYYLSLEHFIHYILIIFFPLLKLLLYPIQIPTQVHVVSFVEEEVERL